MKVFITGPAGFVGSEVLKLLRAAGHDVVGLVRSDASEAVVRQLGGRPVRGDMRDPGGWLGHAADADVLIHTAAVPIGRRGGSAWLRKMRTADLVATRGLIDAARSGGRCRALIYTSGFLAVGDHGDVWVDESTPAVPNARGEAYRAGERLVREACDDGVPGISLRLGWVYGAAGFFARTVLPAAEKGQFKYMGSGNNFMPLVSIRDAADAYLRALEDPPVGEVLNIVDDEPLRMRAIGEILLREFGRGQPGGIPVWLAAAFAGRPVAEAFTGSYRTKNARARELLEWSPGVPTFREGVKPVVEEYRRGANGARR